MKKEKNLYTEDLGLGSFKIIQDKNAFSFGTDAVLLSYFAKIKKNQKVLDIGTGNGAVALLLLARGLDCKITGIEIQKESYILAKENININSIKEKFNVINEDVKSEKFKEVYGSFDIVVSNPPYMKLGSGKICDDESYNIARHEIKLDIDSLIKYSSKFLKSNGKIFIVHRSERIFDILISMKNYKIEPKYIQFVQGNANKNPDIVLIEGAKSAKEGLTVLKSIIVRDDKNNFTSEMLEIYSGKKR